MSQRSSPPVVIPEHPLERFCELYVALLADRPWWQGRTMLRYCALSLATLPGEPRALAARLDLLSEELKTGTAWYKRSSAGTLLAAQLLRHGEGVREFLAEIERAAPLFRAHWTYGGSTFESLAIEILARQSPDGHVAASQVARLAAIWKELERAHPWLTQRSDWPICALLAASDASPREISLRIEALYQELHRQGASRGDALQTAAQVLFFQRDDPALVAARFQGLYAGFKTSGLWMGSHDYDELAILCFAPRPPAEVLELVLRHRERIRALPSAPDKQTSFTLACGTALLELSRDAAKVALLGEAQLVLNVQAIIAAQQAAAVAAASST